MAIFRPVFRTGEGLSNLSESGSIHRHVQMSGFSEKNVQEFAVKYLGEHDGNVMRSQLATQPSVVSLMHTPFFALLICEQFKETRQVPQRRSDIFSSVTLRVAQRSAKRQGLRSSFKCLDKAPTKLFDQVLEVGKLAFDRLKRKDLAYFELEDEDLSPEAVQLGFLEHVHATSSSKADQYGFRHLTVQEYLAALYASTVVLKKAEDVTALAAQLGCGEEAGHLNTFWVFVAGLLESDLCEELFCAIAETDMPTVTGIAHCSTPAPNAGRRDAQADAGEVTQDTKVIDGQDTGRSHSNDQIQPLAAYRFLLLLHCYNEVMMGGKMPSTCVRYVLASRGICLRREHHCDAYGRFVEGPPLLSQADADVVSRMIRAHGDVLKQVDVDLFAFSQLGLHRQLLHSLCHCVCLQKLSLRDRHWFGLHAHGFSRTELALFIQRISYVVSLNSKSLEVLDLSNINLGNSGLHQLSGAMQQCHRLKRLLLMNCGLWDESARDVAAIVSSLPALTELSVDQNILNLTNDPTFTATLIPALQNCKDMEKVSLKELGLASSADPQTMSALGTMLTSLPKLRELDLGNTRLTDSGFLHLAPALQQCSRLKCLKLTYCPLRSSTSMALLVSVLFCLPQLEEFAVEAGELENAHVNQLIIGLMECSRLHKLSVCPDVTSGEMSAQSLVAISHLIERLHHLAELVLPGETSPNRSVGSKLCHAVQGSSSLKTLILPVDMCPTAVSQLNDLVDDPTCALQYFAEDCGVYW